DVDPIGEARLVCDWLGSLKLLDAQKINSIRTDLFRYKVVGRLPREVRVVSIDRLVAPMFAAPSVDDNNIIPRNFLLEISLEVLGCDPAADRLPGKVSDIGFPYQLIRWNPIYAYSILNEVSCSVEMGASVRAHSDLGQIDTVLS